MDKNFQNCYVVLDHLVRLKPEEKSSSLEISAATNQEKESCAPCYVKLEDISNKNKDIQNLLLNKMKTVTPCFVKLEDSVKPLREKNVHEEKDTRQSEIPSNILSFTPKNMLDNRNRLAFKTPAKTNGRIIINEPITPHAHIEFSVELKKVINERNMLTSKTKARVFEALDEIKTKNEEESRCNKREKALLEIVNSEIKYVTQLETIINFFMKPARDNRLLKLADFNILFGNINTIYKLNKELLQELHKGFDNVISAFYKIAPFFKLYSVYAYEFKYSIKILQNARLLNPQFARFVENQETRPEVQSKLSALLITPIQRVPRYKLLLTNLYNLTKPSDKDYKNLSDCLYKVEEAADHINRIVEEQENMQRLLEFQRCLRSINLNVITPGRKLIKEGILMKMAENGTHSEKVYVVLMSDIIVFCKIKGEQVKVNSLKCTNIFPINKCKIAELLDKGCLKIICQDEELVLYNEQFSETKKWIKKVKDTIQDNVNDRKTLRKESSTRRPVKRKDIHEYHEVGLSPGKPLKKRKTENELAITAATIPVRNSAIDQHQGNENERKDLYVYGKSSSGGFHFGKLFGGIGSAVKNLFGFRK